MPASQVHTATVETNGEEVGDTEGSDPSIDGSGNPTVHDFLEMALEAAAEQEMSTSELMGIFFYYAHNIAESYRQSVLDSDGAGERPGGNQGEDEALSG